MALSDGIIRPEENVGAFRSQMVNSMNGKLLRFDPNTGDGIPSNPYYDASNPRASKSRVWALGFRNPFRMSIQPNTGSTNPADGNPGTFLVGDVGFYIWEEINVVSGGGLNCGWPLFEGQVLQPDYGPRTTVNQDEGAQFRNLIAQPTSFVLNPQVPSRRFTHYRPALAWKHGVDETRVPYFSGTTPTDPLIGAAGSPTTGQPFAGNCAIGGVYYTGTAFGAAYQNKYFFGDYGTNIIKVGSLNSAEPWFSSISNFAPANFTNGIVDLEQNPLDNSILYVNINTGEIMRISLAGGLQPPVAAISSDKKFGPSPLSVNFSSAGSSDPEGGPLQYLWDFGDGTTSTQANPAHTYSGTGILSFTVTLTVTDQTSLTASKSLLISLNNTPPTAHITNPVNNSTYSILAATQIQVAATVTDNETTTGMQYAWEQILRHNNHEHREPVVNGPNPTMEISPVGCDGNTYYYLIQLTVTDNGGLTATDSVKIYPDCSTAGLDVANLAATPQTNSVVLSWTNPSVSFDEVMIAAQASTGFNSHPEGTNYTADANFTGTGTAFESGKIVYKGTGQTVTVTNLTPGITYYFRAFTRSGAGWSGGVETSEAPSATSSTNLTGSGVASSATVNLTTEGTSDWAHWYGYDHKSSGGSKISNYTLIGTGVLTYTNDPRTLTWSDGTPTASGSNKNGSYIAGIGNGFQITAPADLTQRTLKVYVGGWMSGGTLTASLSDGSAPNYLNTSFSSTAGQYNAVYTLTYKAASAGKLITVKWTQASGTGNVTIQGATLVQSSGGTVSVTGVTVNPTSASLLVNGTQQLTSTIAPANATNQNVTWSSSNNAVATVSSTGLVTAVAAGSALITVTTQDGAKTATCNITVTQAAVAVTGVTLNPTSASLVVNNTQQLTATIAPANATNKNVTWNSSNNAVATVSSTGLVTAVAAGSAVITVTTQDGGKTATCNITVTQPVVLVTGVTLNPTSASIVVNNTQQLTATIAPANATNKNVTWTSSNNAVATVSSSGLVTAVAAGSAVITVTTQDGGKTATCNVTVTQSVPVLTGSGVSSSSTVNLTTQGTSDWAHWSGYAHKASGGGQISNYTVVGTGTATNYTGDSRRCTWSDGTPTANGSNRNGVYIAGTGKGFQITAPADLTQRTLKVYVGGLTSGGTFTASLSDGSAPDYVNSSFSGPNQYDVVYTLTYKAASAGKLITVTWVQASGTGNVRLQAATLVQVVNVTGVTVSPTSASLTVNGTQQLTATIAPSNATNKNVTWSSSNNTVATVSSTGLVTAVAAGSAVITVTTQDGGKTATCNITVTQATPVPVTGVTLSPTSASLVVNNTQQLTATIAPSNATNKNVTWSSSSTTVATVSSTGLVTALSAGTAVITVTTQDGAKTATCNITVTLPAPGGALTGSGVASSATVNLTTEGTSDWAHWYGYDHKSSGGSKISNYTLIGTGVLTYTNDPRTCTWSDGTPTVSGSNKNGSYIAGIGNGFQITAPADLTQRTLKIYVGGWMSGGTLTASLSDGSAPNYVNTSFSSTAGQYNAVYTLTYKAASAGKLITVKWTQASGTGNVTIQAATLVENPGLVTMATNNAADAVETQANSSLTIFPNPFNDNLAFHYSGNEVGTGVISVYSSEMRLIASYPFEKTSLSLNKQITPKGLTNGLYIIEFQIGHTKIIRQQLRMK
jgi:uncharacterized protein YjdB